MEVPGQHVLKPFSLNAVGLFIDLVGPAELDNARVLAQHEHVGLIDHFTHWPGLCEIDLCSDSSTFLRA